MNDTEKETTVIDIPEETTSDTGTELTEPDINNKEENVSEVKAEKDYMEIIRALHVIRNNCLGDSTNCAVYNTCPLHVCELPENVGNDDRMARLRHAVRCKEEVTRCDTNGNRTKYKMNAIFIQPINGRLNNFAELIDSSGHSILRCPLKEIE